MFKRLKIQKRSLIIAVVVVALTTGAVYGLRAWLLVDLPDLDALDDGLATPSVRIVDRHGRALYEITADGETRHTVVPLDDIPRHLQQATIATEDANFYSHPGVDVRGLVRALWINVRGGEVVAGGSTITQQVARNLLLDPDERAERTLTRKLRESILAWRLSRRFSKDEVLALYLNQTYYGNLAFGVEAASQTYFGKSVNELDLAESALLTGLPQAPTTYDPLTNPEAARERQAIVLGLMADERYITEEEARAAAAEPLAYASTPFPIEAPHFVTMVWAQLPDLLSPEALAQGGLEVRTTLDLDWQRTAQDIAERHLETLNTPDIGTPSRNATDAALVAIDPHTGQILAMLGSPDYFDPQISGAVNMALAPRQPGSAFKPITYAATFDPARDKPWTAATMILDVHTSFVTHDGLSYAPVNYDRHEHGPVLAREALASSYNIPAVIALQEVGMPSALRLASEMGINTLTDWGRYDLALTLGGGEVRLLELTAAYAAFANGGQSVQPVAVLDVRDAEGNVIYTWHQPPGEQVLDERVAWLISDILSDNDARRPGMGANSVLQIGRPAAVKTGTTTDFRDNWTVGYTPDLVVGVWVGNADNSPMVNVSGVSGAGPLWHDFMRWVHKGQPERDFVRPDGLARMEVCALSGQLPTEACAYQRLEWFIEGTEPSEPDTLHHRVTLDGDTGLLADAGTPAWRQVEAVALDLPPTAQDWAQAHDLLLLADLGLVGEKASEVGLAMVSPDAYTVYRIDAGLPIESQRVRVAAVGAGGLSDVRLYVDGVGLATSAETPYEGWWVLAAGDHEAWAEGVDGDGREVESERVPFVVRATDT
jgi:1A family penicillin-binding protein